MISVHRIQGNRIFSFTVFVSRNITMSIDTIGKKKKLSASVSKKSNIFGCVRLETACGLVVRPSTPLACAECISCSYTSLLPRRNRTLFSRKRMDLERHSESLMIRGRNACICSSAATYDGNGDRSYVITAHLELLQYADKARASLSDRPRL